MGDFMKEGDLLWIEIPATRQIGELQDFYSSLFPSWKFHERPPVTNTADDVEHAGYNLPGGAMGGIVRMPSELKAQDQAPGIGMTVYYLVYDLEKTAARVHELGGKTCLPKQKQGEDGWFMNFFDPQGNRFGAYEAAKRPV